MKEKYKFTIGSTVFFKDMDGYVQKDHDVLCIVDNFKFNGNINSMHTMLAGDDLFIYRDMDKEGFIKDALDSNLPMRVGKFLCPEFSKYLEMTIEDLKRMESLMDNLDDKHKYEKDIYDAYIENGDFILTKDQLEKAYKTYKDARK